MKTNQRYDLFAETEIKNGDWLQSRTGGWHQVLRVLGEGHTQNDAGRGWSIPPLKDNKAERRVVLFTGRFLSTYDIDEVPRMYEQIYRPEYDERHYELMDYPID
jgi:hypothetical protein